MQEDPAITAAVSVADYVRVMNRALHGGDEAELRVPEDRAQIEQYLLFFEPEDLQWTDQIVWGNPPVLDGFRHGTSVQPGILTLNHL
jgi:hypothetical protein